MKGVRKAYGVAYIAGLALFAAATAAGTYHSLRLEHRLPRVGLPYDGSEEYLENLLAREDYDSAVRELRLLTLFSPGDHQARTRLGMVLAAQNRLSEAQAEFLRALNLRPHDAQMHYNLGIAYLMEGDAAQAASCLESALAIDPMHPEALSHLGSILGQQGRLTEAAECFERAIRARPDYDEARENLVTARRLLRERALAAP
jgi:Flp pilus assembly protein TadD